MIVATTAALVLLGTLLGLERRRYAGRRRVWRVVALALLVASLWLLVVRPTWTRDVEIEEAVLVTPGWTADGVLAARLEAGSAAPLLCVGTDAVRGATAVRDLGFVMRHYPTVGRLRVAGHGLMAWEWERMPAELLRVGAAPLAAGVSHVHWAREIVLGETWIVRGRVAGDAAAAGRLRLIGPGGVAASTELPVGPVRGFELRATPPRPGRHLYRLALSTADDTPLVEETLDVVVREPDAVAILWLEGAPGFETRHFKRWLTRRGDALVVRSTLSRDRTRVERLNHPPVSVDRLSEDLLRRFDLLVLDGRSGAALERRERDALSAAVEAGLGVLVLHDEAATTDRDLEADGMSDDRFAFLTHWPTRRVDDPEGPEGRLEGLERYAARPLFPDGRAAAALEIAPREVALGRGLLPLLSDDSGVVLAASRSVGSGTAGFSLLADSFRWVLEGNPADHARYWSHVIGGLARRRPDPRWHPPGGVVLVDDPLALALDAGESRPDCDVRDGEGATIRLAPRQDPLDPRRWEATLRPRDAGWHSVLADGGATEFYVQPRSAWQTWRQAQRQAATARRAAETPPAPPVTVRPTPIPVGSPTLPLYAVFLSCLAALWVDERR